MYQLFQHRPDHVNQHGWDAYAEAYAKLLMPDSVYHLTKEVIHRQLADFFPTDRPLHVLDLNCGTGNDFPFFLARGWQITGCDGSIGMLNKACERYGAEIASGQVTLFLGQMESLDARSFPRAKFDLIFSVTGGYSYITDEQALAVNETLGNYLTADGLLVTAHLNKFCPSDIMYQLLHGRMRQAFVRLKPDLMIPIKGREFRMFLRGRREVAHLIPANLHLLHLLPLLWLTPPYQTGFKPPRSVYSILRAIELRTRSFSPFAFVADQIVAVARRKVHSRDKAPALS